jgi:predicted unusual protein kinase regulating ubiquinone biosynthesis (AarF/ABC1/UbiB family)
VSASNQITLTNKRTNTQHQQIHGDLHPGNVLINKDKQFVLLDVGIVVENSKEDRRLISDVLASFIRKDGRTAGRRMMEDSNSRMEEGAGYALEEERYLDKIEGITIRASGKGYLMEHLGKYIAEICDAAAKHHVMLNQAFISAALAVKVQEGIALAMDPSIQIWKIAIPVILEGERRHGYVANPAKEMIGFKGFLDWLRGTTQRTTSNEKEQRL